MGDNFQRLFMMSEPEILPLNAQAALGVVHPPQRTTFAHLWRHFLERFFNHETASPDGDAKTRMVQIAFAAGLPGFAVALYLFPVYHPFPRWPPGSHHVGPPPYWLQVNHHFFFVIYAFVSMGIATVFEWDMFFPDLLDVLVLGTLPIAPLEVFKARVTAIAIFIGGFLVDANFLAPLVLPSTTEPPNLTRFLAGHLAAVALGALFAAAFVLAAQGVLLAVFGERLVRRFSLAVQGLAISILLIGLLLFPIFSAVAPALLESASSFVLFCPPFWFLGIYQRLLEGPAALPIYGQLAQIGCAATLAAVLVAAIAYPVAYLRKVRSLVEGAGVRSTRSHFSIPLNRILHAMLLRIPLRRAVFHFVTQTILRVPRYRIYLVLYGGAGLAVLTSAILRFTVVHDRVQDGVRAVVSSDGILAAASIVAFWTIAGLRMAFVSPGNQRGSWIFHSIHGKPATFSASMELLDGARSWALLAAALVTLASLLVLYAIAPPELRSWPSLAAQWLVAGGMCLLIADIFFFNVTVIAFTGEPALGHSNLALTVLKYYAFFPLVAWLPVECEPWIETRGWHFALAAAIIAAAHMALRTAHRHVVREQSCRAGDSEDEGDFLMKLGLR